MKSRSRTSLRQPRIALRTLFGLVTAASVCCWYIAYRIHEQSQVNDAVDLLGRRGVVIKAESRRPLWWFGNPEFFQRPVSVEFAFSDVKDCDLKLLEPLTSLESVDVQGIDFTDVGLLHLRHMTKLRWLCVRSCDVTGTFISELEACRNLEDVSLAAPIDDDAVKVMVRVWPHLGTVHLPYAAITDKSLPELAKLPELYELYIMGTRLSLPAVEQFEKDRPDVQVIY